MTCEELLAALNDYVDGNLDPGVCDEFRDQLGECSPCQVVVDNIRGTIALYQDGEPFPVPEKLKRSLESSLRARWREKFPAAADSSETT